MSQLPPESDTALSGETADAEAPRDAFDMTPGQREEARQYGHRSLVCDLIDMVLDVAFLAVMAILLARPLDGWLSSFSLFENRWLRLAAMVVVITILHMAVSLPLSFYSGFVLEHRYGLSRLSLVRWVRRYLGRNGLSLLLSLALVTGMYALVWYVGWAWWMVGAVAMFAVSVVLGQLVPVIILPLFFPVSPVEDEELARRLEPLTEGTGLKLSGVYRIGLSVETAKANAMLTGLGRTRRVLLGDTLLDRFTPEEIEVVMAHEIGHHVLGHIRKLILLGLVGSVATLWLCDRVLVLATGFARNEATTAGPFDYSTVPVWTLPALMLTVTLLSLLMMPVRNAISRRFERQCDRYALDRTGNAAAYHSAFTKLARLNKDDPQPHPVEVFLLHDHPPIAERLAMAEHSG